MFLRSRGFSLVELMVVVAIMGTLAAIAIPAYNEYRKSAKKTAYKSDLAGLHKGWLAFGVELDNFCDRESDPQISSISGVGMSSLITSKLYGNNASAVSANCNGASGSNCVACTLDAVNNTCTGFVMVLTPGCNSTCSANYNASIPAGNGPGKHNFIGFGTDRCSIPNLQSRSIRGNEGANGANPTVADGNCTLDEVTYKMGVYGQITGADYFGISIDSSSVLGAEKGTPATPANANPCT